MKLHLSSYRVPQAQKLFALTGKNEADIRVAIVPNAGDYYSDRARRVKHQDIMNFFTDLGVTPEIVDLQNYADGSDEILENQLKQYDIVWVSGGNTFCLREEMVRTGFDNIIGKVLDAGVVYAGESAGAVAIGKSLRGTELADDPRYAEKQIFEGLGIVPFVVIPHTDNPEFAEANSATREQFEAAELFELKDSQAVIFDGEFTNYVVVER